MTRVRFDPTIVEDPSWEGLGAEALALHVCACAYTVKVLSDGRVSRARLRVLTPLVDDPLAVAEQLVQSKWWRVDGSDFIVCEVRDDLRHSDGRGDEQPSKTYVRGEQERAAKRKADWKARQVKNVAGTRSESVPNGGQHSPDRSGAGLRPSPASGATSSQPKGDEFCSADPKHGDTVALQGPGGQEWCRECLEEAQRAWPDSRSALAR